MPKNSFDWIGAICVLFVLLIIAGMVYAAIGYGTQSETLSATVTGKQIQKVTDTDCETATSTVSRIERTKCTSTDTYYYKIFTDKETFNTTDALYYQLTEHCKYSLKVMGWTWFTRYISQIVEVGTCLPTTP